MDNNLQTIWILDDDKMYCDIIEKYLLKHGGYHVAKFYTPQTFFESFEKTQPNVLILDHFLGRESGLDVLSKIRETNETCKIIYMSSQEKVSVAIRSLKNGAFAYLEKNVQEIKKLPGIINQEYSKENNLMPDS